MSQALRIVFAGTPEFAAEHLKALLDTPHRIVAVYTQPDRPAGRGQKLMPSAVKSLALEHGLPVMQPQSLRNAEAQAELAALRADLMVVVAYGLILPQAVLDTPRLGCISNHASLLPRWRGAAPIQRGGSRRRGERRHRDADGSRARHRPDAAQGEHADFRRGHRRQPARPARRARPESGGRSHRRPGRRHPAWRGQDDALATYAHKLNKDEARLDWSRPAVELERRVRAFTPGRSATPASPMLR